MKPNILFVEAAVILLIGGWSVVKRLLSMGSGTGEGLRDYSGALRELGK